MAFRELTMIDVTEVLRRWQVSQADREIARGTGADRKTVARYIEVAEAIGLPRDRTLDEDEVHEVAQRVQSRPSPPPSDAWKELEKQREKIAAWLGQDKPLRLSKVHKLLTREGVEVTYATLRRYAMTELGWRKARATVRLDDPPPATEAQVDFGKMGMLRDAQTGKKRALWALVVTLSFSRYMFVWPLFRQTTEALVEGLDAAWEFFRGMPRYIIPDNMKAAVDRSDPLAPTIVAAFAEYLQARGLFMDAARVRKPRDKARVENQVAYVRESWFEGETFSSLEEARASARKWAGEEAGRRIHGTTRRVPRDVYEAEELPQMLPPPTEPFDVPIWGDAKVHADHHIQFAGALYSAPTKYLHKRVRVRGDRTTVKLYLGSELVKVHPRKERGGRSTDTRDYPVGKSIYALRSVETLLAKAKERGHHIGVYAERLLGGPLPWTRMRQAYALLGLCDKYGEGRVEAICQSALAFDVIDVVRIKKMLLTAASRAALVAEKAHDDGCKVVMLSMAASPRFARPASHFATKKSQGKEVS
jgi:transposase